MRNEDTNPFLRTHRQEIWGLMIALSNVSSNDDDDEQNNNYHIIEEGEVVQYKIIFNVLVCSRIKYF